MNTERFRFIHIDECLSLLELRYCGERKAVPFLPPFWSYLPELRLRYEALAGMGLGRVLIESGRVRGMMGGFPVPELFGGNEGVFVPVWANLRDGTSDREVLTELYSACAEVWVREGRTSHCLNIFAHDRPALDSLVRLGFGMRCVDAIRETARLSPEPPGFEVLPVGRERVGLLAELHRAHNLYYRSAPLFMPHEEEDPVRDLLDWLESPDRRLFACFEGGRCLGYIRLERSGDSLFSSHPSMRSLTALFVAPEARGRSVGAALLDAAEAFLAESGCSLTGVDYESLNPLGSRFWERYFRPYTLSLARRVDERVLAFLD